MIALVIAGFATLIGVGFLLVAGVGLLRMEDLFTRLHSASKAAPFGASMMLIGVAVAAGSVEVIVRVIVICFFLILTAPIAGHLIGRAAYLDGARPGPHARDELEGRYDREAGELRSATLQEVSEDGRSE